MIHPIGKREKDVENKCVCLRRAKSKIFFNSLNLITVNQGLIQLVRDLNNENKNDTRIGTKN